MRASRRIIVYIPYRKGVRTANSNEYLPKMIEILEEKYDVTGELASPLNFLTMLKTKAVFLNYVEETGLSLGMKAQILMHKVFGAEIIWAFQNKYPHDAIQNKVSTGNMNWLSRYSDKIMLHSRSSRKYIPNALRNGKKAVYVPHILYDSHGVSTGMEILKTKYGIQEEDFVFTIFGVVRPYKKIENGIEAFRKIKAKNAKLLIAGAPVDVRYARKIKAMCKNEQNIILDMNYLSDMKLDIIIDISDVILLPYKNKSSANSGVMIHSFSRGKTVIAPDICMAIDFAPYHFFYMYRNSLEEVMQRAYENGKDYNRHMGLRAKKYIERNNNREVVKRHIYDMLK